jgi:hypothetical protein
MILGGWTPSGFGLLRDSPNPIQKYDLEGQFESRIWWRKNEGAIEIIVWNCDLEDFVMSYDFDWFDPL